MGDVIHGLQDFEWKRLHVLQIGLGTCSTVVENLANSCNSCGTVAWLLEAASNNSPSLLTVGVEPIPDHLAKLRPFLKSLPNTALVEAAIVRHGSATTIHGITDDKYQRCLAMLDDADVPEFERLCTYLRNMSCVGQDHPDFKIFSSQLYADFNIKLDTEPINVKTFTFGGLARSLRFVGAEILLIDAEGYDCQILQSMIEYCAEVGDARCWPDVIQFETLGHSDKIEQDYAERNMIRALKNSGYMVACYGNDTQLIKITALQEEARLEQWVNMLRCERCGNEGISGMPFKVCKGVGLYCYSCGFLHHMFGETVWSWEILHASPGVMGLATDGRHLCVLGCDGVTYKWVRNAWICAGGLCKQIAVASDVFEIWGITSAGGLARSSLEPERQWTCVVDAPTLQHVSVSGDGHQVWCLDRNCGIHMYLPMQAKWLNIDGKMKQISVTADGQHVWGVNIYDQVFYRPGLLGSWVQVSGKFHQISVSADGWHVWGVNDYEQLYYRCGLDGHWNYITGSKVRQVCVSSDGSQVWCLCAHLHVWVCHLWSS